MTETKVVYIGLGSNLDEPEKQLLLAFDELDGLPETRLLARSSLYRNPPMGPQDQPDYINAVAKLETALEPAALLQTLQQIEATHDRRRDMHWGPRSLDLDLLLYDHEQINSDTLTVPHPGIAERNFVLYPLAELDAALEIPGVGLLDNLLNSCSDSGLVKLKASTLPGDVGC